MEQEFLYENILIKKYCSICEKDTQHLVQGVKSEYYQCVICGQEV